MESDTRNEIKIWKQRKKRAAASRKKRLNGLRGEDVLLECMEWTTLHHIAGVTKDNGVHIAKDLVALGLNNQADSLGRKPLWYAAQAGNDALIPTLMDGLDDSDVDAAFCIALDWQRITAACTILQERPTFECTEDTRNVFSMMLHSNWDEYKGILSLSNEKYLFAQYLNHASYTGDDEIVKRAIALNVSVNEHDHLERTPLHNAAQQFNISTLHILLEAGADPLKVDNSGCTCAHYVSSVRNHSNLDKNKTEAKNILQALVKANPSLLNQKNFMGRTPLLEALYRGNEEMVLFIIKNFLHHIDTSVRDHFGFSYSHYSPLHADELANGMDSGDISVPNVSEKVNKKLKTTYKEDSMIRFVKWINKRFSLSIQTGMDLLSPFSFHEITQGQQEKTSVLHMCIKMQQIEMLDFLATKENCSVQDDQGRTPLRFAVDMMNAEALSCILQHVSPNPSEIEDLLRHCEIPSSNKSPLWKIIQLLLDAIDVEGMKTWLTDVNNSKTGLSNDKKTNNEKLSPKLKLLQYCFLWGSDELVSSICNELSLAELTKGHSNEDPTSLNKLSPLEVGALRCRQEVVTSIPLREVPQTLKDNLLALSCSFGSLAKEKISAPYLSAFLAPDEEDIVAFVSALLESGADPEKAVFAKGPAANAIQAAAFHGFGLVTDELISNRASPCGISQNRCALESCLEGDQEDLFLKMLDTLHHNELPPNLGLRLMTVASRRGHWEAVDKLTSHLEKNDEKISEVFQDDHGDTCLHHCALAGKHEHLRKCLHLLAKDGQLSSLAFLNKTGRSALCCATLHNEWQSAFVIMAYLNTDVLPSKLLERIEHVIFNASNDEDTEDISYKNLVRRLLPYAKDLPHGANVFMKTCACGDLEAVKQLLTTRPDLVETEDAKNRRANVYASINGQCEIANYVENFTIEQGYDRQSNKGYGQLLLGILINRAWFLLKHRTSKRPILKLSVENDLDYNGQNDIMDLIANICTEGFDAISSTVQKFEGLDDTLEVIYSNMEPFEHENSMVNMSLRFLSLFVQVRCPLVDSYYKVDDSDWSDYKGKYGVKEDMPYPDPLGVALLGKRLAHSDSSFVTSLIQTYAKDHCLLTTVAIDTLLKSGELNLLCDIFSVRTNISHYKLKMHATFLRACSAGHFALAMVTSAFIKDDKDIRVLGLNLAIASGYENLVQMLSSGICPSATVSADYCAELFQDFPRAWKRKVHPGWSPIFASAASNNLPLLYSFLDTCEHVSDELLAETALVAASRGSYQVLEHILMRQPRVLYIDTDNLPLVKYLPELATVSLLACCVKSKQDSCGTLVIGHMLSQGYLSQSLVDVLPFACELGLVETVKSLLAIPDQIVLSESQLNLSKSACLELGHLQLFKTFDSKMEKLLPDCNYGYGLSKFVRDMSLSDGEDIPLPFRSTFILSKLLKDGKETTVFHILQRIEELEILSIFNENEISCLLMVAVQSQSFGVLEPLLNILDHITSAEKVNRIVYQTLCLAIKLHRAESLRSVFMHRNIVDLPLQMADKPHILHVGAIFGDAEVGKVFLEFLEAKDLQVSYNGMTPHEVAVGFGNQQMAQVLNPLAVNFH